MKRDKKNAVLGGVCAGIANYLDVPVVGVRIAFILGCWLAGIPLLLYPLLWLLMPAEE
jgi:phage shock protein PspC (stress-responsive transcriptional regulator)